MNSKFLSVMLMALILVVACAARPGNIGGETITGDPINLIPNTTNIPRRMSTFAMGCQTSGNTKICTDQNRQEFVLYDDFTDVNDHFLFRLPDWKKYTSYEFCFGKSCAAMTTLTGSEFYPKNYYLVARRAVDEMYSTRACIDSEGYGLLPTAIDIYYYDANFVFSWWFNDPYTYRC